MSGLLVSVKSRAEAIAAVTGGADILDIKDPNNGSLGMAKVQTIDSILEQIGQNESIQASVALGELEDWTATKPIPSSLNEADYLKVGPGNTGNIDQWLERLLQLRTRFQSAGIIDPQWIAVLYADQKPGLLLRQSQQQQLNKIATKLKEHTFAGLLIDTAQKQNGSLRTYFSNEQLRDITQVLQSYQLLCSLAGRLNFQDIEILINQSGQPDYYAVRSAVCTAGDRQSNVECNKVEELKRLLNQSGI